MKILILGDLHLGCNDGNTVIMLHQLKILNDIINYCVDNNINKIIQTGDMFDVRKYTNTYILHKFKNEFFDKIKENNIELTCIVGNHDSYYKNTLNPNTITEHLHKYKNITILSNSETKFYGNNSILFVPWMCKDNQEQCLKSIKTSNADCCVLHPEITGASMGGSICDNGLSQSLFSHFKTVIAGHFHIKGKYSNINYVGTPYQLTWQDYGEEKGFHILETDNSELTFIPTNSKLFHRIIYDDDYDISIIKTLNLSNCFVKVSIGERQDFKHFDLFISELEKCNLYDLKIIEPLMELDGDNTNLSFDGDLVIKATETLITDYIRDLYPEKLNSLNNIMLSIHQEARND